MGLIIFLILTGILLILVELLLLPGIAVAGIFGVGALGYACYLGFTHYGYVGGVIILLITLILVTLFVIYSLRSKTWRKAQLNTNITSKVDTQPADKGIQKGMMGISTTRLNPVGMARFGDKNVEVKSIDGFIDQQTELVVAYLENEKILVKRYDKDNYKNQ